jgi:hypothetical protein
MPEHGERLVYQAKPETEKRIPLYSALGRIIGNYTLDEIAVMGGVEVVRKRSGEPVRAKMKPITNQVRETLTAAGSCFLQHLANGHAVYALQGVRGSR